MNNHTGPISKLVHEFKKIASAVSASFLNLIYQWAGTDVHLLQLKGSMGRVGALL